jgi:UDP-glucose 4-epimerase
MPNHLTVLVTGGAGYIGSHVVRQLVRAGRTPIVFDNLSTGHAWAVLDAELIVGDLGDRSLLADVLGRRRFDAVMHFAASIWVGESVQKPAKYYQNNVSNALGLFALAAEHGVPQIVFSSTAAVYGEPEIDPIPETTPLAPINPYGASKMMSERILTDIARAADLRVAILRYFNVAGADLEGQIGEATPDNSHLIKVACEVAYGLRPGLQINGTNYPTADGTCVRDYLHVQDLARAHVLALDHLAGGGRSVQLNCGYGHGFSVREVVETVRRVTGVDFPVTYGPKRAGDPPRLVAAVEQIRTVLGFEPQYDDLELIVRTAWAWEQTLQARLAGGG